MATLNREQAHTLDEYRALVTLKSCPDCGAPLPGGLHNYDHDGGLPVVGFAKPQWLFIECLRCDYQWALWKLLRRQKAEKANAEESHA